MPEKVKIHLKNNLSMERNPAAAQKLSKPTTTPTTAAANAVDKTKNGRFDKSKKTTSNVAISSAGKLSKNDPTKTGFETGKSGPETGKSALESRQQQIRRARSVGPVVEAAQRELSHLDLKKVLTGNPAKPGAGNRPESPTTSASKERRSRSRGRTGLFVCHFIFDLLMSCYQTCGKLIRETSGPLSSNSQSK